MQDGNRAAQACAIRVLRITTDLYPDSANTWDSLASACQQAGNREKAIERYRNALACDPEFASVLGAWQSWMRKSNGGQHKVRPMIH